MQKIKGYYLERVRGTQKVRPSRQGRITSYLLNYLRSVPGSQNHMASAVSRQQVEEALDSGAFQNEERDSYWIEHSEHGRIGYIRFEDLCDDTPVFDLRLASQWQGRGLGVEVLNAATSWIFEQKPRIRRFEGQTRDDNLAMRHTFLMVVRESASYR